MRWLIGVVLAVLSVSGISAAPHRMSEAELMAKADIVVTGRFFATGFSRDMVDQSEVDEFTVVGVESVQKGVPLRPLKLLIDNTLLDLTCCVTGARYKMYLKHRHDGFYEAVDGRHGIVPLN